MSSYFLCSHCYNWVRPYNGHCPECAAGIDIEQPDPPLDQLRTDMGELVMPLGAVRIARKHLPGQGLLYATTRGLFFLPHRVEQVTRFEERRVGPPLLWRIAALLWSPLYLLLFFFRGREVREIQVAEQRPQVLETHEGELLPELLMDNPGAFFLPLNSIRGIERRRDRWLLDRNYGGRITVQADADYRLFDERMCRHLESPEWQHVVTRC